MPVGLQIWNANGTIALDGTTRCARITGVHRVEGYSSSVAVDLSSGEPFWSFMTDQLYFHISNQMIPPVITIDAN